jgi:D,D-heptose 1,7-bisphosphate phosphatase
MAMSNKAVFLDRDNTLIDDPGYINDPSQVHLLDGVPEALNGMRAMDYKLVVITNQSGVARGIVTEDVLSEIHQRLEDLLAEQGASIDRIYYCPYHIDGVIKKYRKQSDWRKPNPGMLLAAAEDMDIDLNNSWCIGNSQSDIEAGVNAGCHTILIDAMSPVGQLRPEQIHPDYIAVNMREALNIVKKHQHTPVKKHKKPLAKTALPQAVAHQQAPPATPAPEGRAVTRPAVAKPASPPPEDPPDRIPTSNTEHLLRAIHEQLKTIQRDDMFDEFSIVRLVAGVTQIGVFFCLIIAVWFLMSPERPYQPVFTALGFSGVLQLMSLTLSMHGRK